LPEIVHAMNFLEHGHAKGMVVIAMGRVDGRTV
jgi:hypothetical protein